MSIVQSLIDTKSKLQAGWTQLTYARNKEGEAVPVRAPDACSFCIMGAMRAAGAWDHYEAFCFVREAIGETGVQGTIPEFNDRPEATQDEVVAVIDRAIEIAQKRGWE